MKIVKRSLSVVMVLLAFIALLPGQAFAAGKIETDRDVTLTISYDDEGTPIANAKFTLYKVGDVDEYFHISLTPAFEAYRNTVDGLNELEEVDQAGWLSIAATLKGYVLRDGVAPAASDRTDNDGRLQLAVKPGLYLVIGTRITLEESFYTYTATPYMIFLPGLDTEKNEWVYTVTTEPKFEKGINPPDDPDDISRKVIKTWDDSGYESIRPEEVTVQLLRDGSVYDTKVLNKENNWRYKWDELDPRYEWLIVEKEMDYYVAKISRTGITFNVTNKYIVPITKGDPPVQKRVTGDEPQEAGLFTFVMEAMDPTNPMPAGSEDGKKIAQISGAGSVEFGDIVFDKPGTYRYLVYEMNLGAAGYTYDNTRYYVTYVVKLVNEKLTCTRIIEDTDYNKVAKIEFTNKFKTPPKPIPKTGQLWWPVPVLLLSGMVLLTAGVAKRRKYER